MSTSSTVGTANTKNGTRQPNASATYPAPMPPIRAPTALPARWNENTRGRTSTG